jgi:hypothetical protein
MNTRQRVASDTLLLGCWLAVSMSSAAAAALVARTLTF